MTKSFSQLWPRVVSWRNLLWAYHRCRRRKRYKTGAVEFEFDWEGNLLQLQRELVEGTWRPGPYHHFQIVDPKPRRISAAPFRDRVVHHAVVNVLEPLFERRFIHDSYACRRGRGAHRALERAQHFLRRHPWYLKTDIVRFFPNVDHAVLLTLLERHIRDSQFLALIRLIIASGEGILESEATSPYFPGDDLLAALRPRGLPIGNLTSQFFANVLLDPIDHFLKEELRIPGYVRYADDLLLFAESKSRLREVQQLLIRRLAESRLRLHPHKTQVHPTAQGVTFLGFRLFPNSRRLSQAGIQRFVRRRRQMQRAFAEGRLGAAEVRQSLRSWLAHLRGANSLGIRRQLLVRLILKRSRPPRSPDPK